MWQIAPVSCRAVTIKLGGVGFGFWLMGKLGRAWYGALHGAWVHGLVHGIVHGIVCMLPG